ncbi:phytanoyl-CoA dioxygenase family protein [soil metagenome]
MNERTGLASMSEKPYSTKTIADAQVGPDTAALWSDITSHGLAGYVGEIDVTGYTVIPPDVAGTTTLWPRLLERILDVAEQRTGERPDMDGRIAHTHSSLGLLLSYLLFEDDAFQELLLNPVVLALQTYMLGKNAKLSSMQSQLKAAGDEDLPIHCDNVLFSSPFAPHYQFCNISINLTDYAQDSGPICFVPGSHKLYRHPTRGEGYDQRVPAYAPPGSLIAFTGNTWHGAFARQAAGLRASLLMQFVRPQIRPFEPYREDVTPELVRKLGPRFGTLMGQDLNHGWRAEGPVNEGYAYNMGSHAYD